MNFFFGLIVKDFVYLNFEYIDDVFFDLRLNERILLELLFIQFNKCWFEFRIKFVKNSYQVFIVVIIIYVL